MSRVLSLGEKHRSCEADQSSPSGAEVKYASNYTPPPNIFMAEVCEVTIWQRGNILGDHATLISTVRHGSNRLLQNVCLCLSTDLQSITHLETIFIRWRQVVPQKH
jgi:hypothetical protein